ncbi:MAG: class I SAM-dependent methyltransferase [Vulcanimicrobiaceae bacterium]
MSATAVRLESAAARRSHALLEHLYGSHFLDGFAVELWDELHLDARGPERFVMRLRSPSALRVALTPPLELGPGRAFALGLLEVEGDLEFAVDRTMRALDSLGTLARAGLLALSRTLPAPPPDAEEATARHGRSHTPGRDAESVRRHYDLPPNFFRTFLDPELVYSCAYFAEGHETLAAAQSAKLDHILRKLRIRPGDRLLDVGCGWGALVIRAAERFGALATGITLSPVQRDEALQRIRARGLTERASVELLDYRALGSRLFDRIASVGMIEHVGRERYREYFRALWKALRPGGLLLNHGIVDQSPGRRGVRASGFIDQYVFPDGDLVSIGARLSEAERIGFEVRDVENLREHYARTLRAWYANLECNRETALALVGERLVRIWRLYLAGSAQGFASGRLGIVQCLLAKADPVGRVEVPPTRADLYRASASQGDDSTT